MWDSGGGVRQRLLADLDCIAGGCVLCRCSDFLKDGFGPRTIIICDQCEREFHIGCLDRYMDKRYAAARGVPLRPAQHVAREASCAL